MTNEIDAPQRVRRDSANPRVHHVQLTVTDPSGASSSSLQFVQVTCDGGGGRMIECPE